jgi:hypothetical protein
MDVIYRRRCHHRLVTRSLPRTVAVLAAVLATCVGVVPASAANAGAFTVTPNVSDPSCNGGAGVQLPTHGFKSAAIASGRMGDGSTLTAFGQIYPGQAYVVLDAVTPQCAPDAQFGSGGTARITVPAGLIPPTKPRVNGFGFWIIGIAASNNGGAIVTGIYRNRWVVASVSSQGTLDPAFGAAGWVAPPMHGEASEAVQTSSGEVIVAGDNEGGGCCTVNHAVALTATGRLDKAFGNNGSVVLPTGEDSGVSGLSLLPDGDILAQVNYGNMGCWGHRLALFTATGKPVVGFAAGMNRFWQTHSYGAFVGDAYGDATGITLVGMGQRGCADGRKISGKTAHGVIAHFSESGAVVGAVTRFPSKLYGEVNAFPRGANTLLVEGSFGDTRDELLRLIGADGTPVTSFGTSGVVRLTLPWQGAQASFLNGIQAEPVASSLTVVATVDGKTQLAVTRLSV